MLNVTLCVMLCHATCSCLYCVPLASFSTAYSQLSHPLAKGVRKAKTERRTAPCQAPHCGMGSLWDFQLRNRTHSAMETCRISSIDWIGYDTSSTAQGGGGSFKNRKPIGEIGCCESGMAERSHWWIEKRLISLTLSLTIYLPTYLSSYVSIYLSIYLSLSLFHLITYLPIYLSIYLFLCLCLSLSPSSV